MHIEAAGVVVRNSNGQILVLHRKDFVAEGTKWGLPGGKVREKLGPLGTALFKAQNEAGLEFKKENLLHLGEFKFIDGEGNDVIYNAWVADLGTSSTEINFDKEGHDYYKWENPEVLVRQNDLMVGVYPILRKYIGVNREPPRLPSN